jgi:hypothetical protein
LRDLDAGCSVADVFQARPPVFQPVACGAPLPIWDLAPTDRLAANPSRPDSYFITNRLSIHLGEAPLPKFDDGYVYGDLHYHSQGTDNEGESAYALRPTLQAMRAMGLDFLFATDHASDSGQVTDIDEIFINDLHLPSWTPDFIADYAKRLAASQAVGAQTRTNAARDTNPQRFRTLRAWLNDPGGANGKAWCLRLGCQTSRPEQGGTAAPAIGPFDQPHWLGAGSPLHRAGSRDHWRTAGHQCQDGAAARLWRLVPSSAGHWCRFQ